MVKYHITNISALSTLSLHSSWQVWHHIHYIRPLTMKGEPLRCSQNQEKRQLLLTCLPRYLEWKNCLKWMLPKSVCIYSIANTQIGSNVEFLEPIKTSRHCFDFLLLLFLLAAFSSCPLKCFIMFCSPELINHRLPCCSTWLWVPCSSSGLFVFFLGCLSFSELLLSFFLLLQNRQFCSAFLGWIKKNHWLLC